MTDELVPASRCAWCSAAAPIDATQCPSCGAALAQRESIGDLVIPGVTTVDPALLDIDGRPMRIPGASPSQGMASGAMVAVMAGGPIGLATLGGMAVVGAAEYAMAGRREREGVPALEDVGRPSSIAAELAERLDHGSLQDDDPSSDPWRDEPRR